MQIALGSTSGAKLGYLEEFFKANNIYANISTHNVDSEITDQPLSEEVTIAGASNRARNALLANPKAKVGVGLEGGLQKINDLLYMVCVVVIRDTEGTDYIGISNKYPLPREVSEAIESGEQFGEVIRAFEKKAGEEHIKVLTEELVSREKSFKPALTNSYQAYVNCAYL